MKISRDYLLTFITEFVVLVAGILVYKLSAHVLGKDGFSQYALCRRTISFMQPLMILGLGVGIPRYIAFASADKSMKKTGSYFTAGFFIIMSFSIIVLVVMSLAKDYCSYLIFGSRDFHGLIVPIEIMLCGMIVHSVCYGYFRGRMFMINANILQFLNMAVIPLSAFMIFKTIESVMIATGTGILIISCFPVVYILYSDPLKWHEITKSCKELLRYGVQRVPGDVALGGFLALPAYLTAHFVHDDLRTAGYVAFAMSLLNMAGAAFGPISLMLLPEASKIIVNKDFHLMRRQINRIAGWTLAVTMLGLLMVEVFASPLLKIYLGNVFTDGTLCIRIVMVASLGYTMYISLRSILDAYYIKAVNTRNIFIAFVCFVAGVWVLGLSGFRYDYMLYVFIFSLSLLGFLTYVETKKIVKHLKV